MESNKNLPKTQPTGSTGSTVDSTDSGAGHSTPSTHRTDWSSTGSSSNPAASAPARAREVASAVTDKAGEVLGQTKEAMSNAREVVSNAYDKTSETLSNTYDQALTYGRQNPGTVMLIAFGAGVGIGLLLAGSLTGRSRMNRVAEPIVGALSQVALEFLR